MAARRLGEILAPASVLVPLEGASPSVVIAALCAVLPLGAPARSAVEAAALGREAAGSTGIGEGVAIPHARVPGLAAPALAAGLCARPVDFRAADGKNVRLVFLLAVPDHAPQPHLAVLGALSRLLMDKALLRKALKSRTAADLHDLLATKPL